MKEIQRRPALRAKYEAEGFLSPCPASTKPVPENQTEEARKWLRANPGHPKAEAVRSKLQALTRAPNPGEAKDGGPVGGVQAKPNAITEEDARARAQKAGLNPDKAVQRLRAKGLIRD